MSVTETNNTKIMVIDVDNEGQEVNGDTNIRKILNDQVKVEYVKPTYWQLYRFASKRDWFIMFIGAIFAIIAGGSLPLTTVIFGQVVDYFTEFQKGHISKSAFTDNVKSHVMFFLYLAIVVFTSTYIYMATWVYTGERLTRQIRERYLRAVLRQNIAYFDKVGTGITTRITSDTHLIQDGISEKVSMALSYVALFISAFIVAFVRSWKMTLAICALIPLVGITSTILNKFTSVFMNRAFGYYSKSGMIAEESISTIRTAVAFGIQSKLSKLFDSNLIFAKREGIKKGILSGICLGTIHFFNYSTYALAFWYGSTMILKSELTSGGVINIFFAVIVGSIALINISPEIQAFSFAIAAGSKIFETINRVPPIDIESKSGDKLDKVEGRIQLKNVSFIYPARPEVMTLKKVSLDIEPGTTVALVGSSGSGKSTIVSLILRFYDPVEGEIHMDGRNIKDLNLQWLRRQIGLVGQEPVLFNTTVTKNVGHGLIGSAYENLDEDKKFMMIEQACKMANAYDFIMNLPDKYETNVGEGGFLLSGGQKQRIAIARAIVKDPKILLLDEATSALDTQNEGIVQDALDKASKNRTTIVIAHRLSTIKNATKIVVMNLGDIVEIGAHDELMSKKGSYFKLVETQRIKQAKLARESDFLSDDQNELLKPGKEIVEDYTIGRTITNRSSTSTVFTKLKDVEAGKLDYEYTTMELLRKIGKINKPEILYLIVGLFSCIVAGLVNPIYAVFFAKVIQSFSKTGDELRHDARYWSLMFLIVAFVMLTATIIQGISFGISGENLTLRIRSMSYAAILRQDISFFDREDHSVGALTSILSLDATKVNGLAGTTLGTLLQASITIVSGFIVALIVGWKMALVCLACIPFLVGLVSLRMKMLNGYQQKTKEAYEQSARIACEGACNIRTVAALTREEELCYIYHKMLDEPMRQGFNNAFLSSITYALAQSINCLTYAVAFWFGCKLFVSGEYNLERMFTVFIATIFGSMSAGRVFAFAPDIARAKSSAATIINLIESTPVIDSWSHTGTKLKKVEGNIKFTDVNFQYPTRSHVKVLRGLNIEVKSGQYAALVGSSGCGKSTTIGLTERFYETTGGKIEIDGIDIKTININNLREHIALVSQEPSLYDMTIKGNILLGCKPDQNPTQEDIERVCKEANIHDFIITLPDGYDTTVGSRGTQLSGGQKQRIAIARALIRNPKILLLDEATSALDSESEKVVQKALDAAAIGRTTLAIAHRLSTIQHADVIFVIKRGKVVEQGTHQELLAKKGTYFNMVQEQDLGDY